MSINVYTKIISIIKKEGYISIGDYIDIDEVIYNEIFNDFNEILDKNLEYLYIDKCIDNFIKDSNSPIVNDSAKVCNLKKEFLGSEVFSYQYHKNIINYLKKYILDEKIPKLIFDMDYLFRSLELQLKIFLNGIPVKYECILKIWKWCFIEEKSSNFFAPVHYDRTLFTIVLSTKNPFDEGLIIGPYGSRFVVEDFNEKYNNFVDFYIPEKKDLPVMFTGLKAQQILKINATPHGVLRKINKNSKINNRMSLVFFIVPSTGVEVNQRYV